MGFPACSNKSLSLHNSLTYLKSTNRKKEINHQFTNMFLLSLCLFVSLLKAFTACEGEQNFLFGLSCIIFLNARLREDYFKFFDKVLLLRLMRRGWNLFLVTWLVKMILATMRMSQVKDDNFEGFFIAFFPLFGQRLIRLFDLFPLTECQRLSDGSFECASPSAVCSFACNVTGCDEKKSKVGCPRVTSYWCRDPQDPDPAHGQMGYHYECMTLKQALILLEQVHKDKDIAFAHYFRYRFGM